MSIVWIDNVPSQRCHVAKTAARSAAYATVDATYGTSNPTWSTSAAIVPKIPTITTAAQYTYAT